VIKGGIQAEILKKPNNYYKFMFISKFLELVNVKINRAIFVNCFFNCFLTLMVFGSAFASSSSFAGNQNGAGYNGDADFNRKHIRIVGSSTVYPFTTIIAENFGKTTIFDAPIVESTGTGGGFQLFCGGASANFPDFVNASRYVKESELALCAKNGIKQSDILELKIGFDGIVLANATGEHRYNLTTEQIFLALANFVPKGDKLQENPYEKWSDIDESLPNIKIEVYGPPPTSGTRDAFVEIVMSKGCKKFPQYEKTYPDKKQRKIACHMLREDGVFIETGENDNLIIQKLKLNKKALGIFGYSFLEQNSDIVQASVINKIEPAYESISSGAYPISRPMFIYAKLNNADKLAGMKEFLQEIVSEDAIGEFGYLTEHGLVVGSEEARQEMSVRLESSLEGLN